jgi:hypothetical protein
VDGLEAISEDEFRSLELPIPLPINQTVDHDVNELLDEVETGRAQRGSARSRTGPAQGRQSPLTPEDPKNRS